MALHLNRVASDSLLRANGAAIRETCTWMRPTGQQGTDRWISLRGILRGKPGGFEVVAAEVEDEAVGGRRSRTSELIPPTSWLFTTIQRLPNRCGALPTSPCQPRYQRPRPLESNG